MILRRRQRGYLLITVVVTLFLLATVAVLLTQDSAINANSSSAELETARADYVAQAGMQHALWRAGNNACMGDVSIPATTLGDDSYTASITGAAAGTSYVLSADQDAWIRNDDPTKNNGTSASNHVRQKTGNIEQVLTRFDLSALPANAQINSAVAWFHLKALNDHPEGPITVHEITADWGETTVTWDSFGGAYRQGSVGIIPPQDTGDVWVSINLTGPVQAWVNGQPNNGILFESQSEGLYTEYTAREDGANPPRLEVVVGSGSPSPVIAQVTGTLDNGLTRTLTEPIVIAYQPSVTHTFRPDPAESDDAEIWDQAPNNNYGDAAETWVSSASNDRTRTLLRFDMGAIPTGAKVLGASLYLYRQSGSGADQPVSAHRIISSWSEGSVTWNNRDSGTNWNTAGGDFDAMPVATTPVGPGNQLYEWDITPLVQGWVDGSYPNYGVALTAAIDGMPGERFYTSDQANLGRRPSLSVSYACECGSPCVAPRGTGRIALIGDDSSPDPDDQLKIQIIESWGYEVDFFEDQNSDTINWSNYDLAYVSETVISGDVSANLTDLSIGVVNEEPKLYDDLQLASGNTEHVGSSINIIDNGHFITSIFLQGPLSIYTGDMEVLTADSPLAGGLTTLGQFSGAASLTALDHGAQTTSGTAAGRRVTLPLGQHFASGFNWTNLGHNGHLLVQRAIAWAMYADVGGSGTVLMVVGNDAGLTTQESAKKSLIESWGYTVNVIDEDDNQGAFTAAFSDNDVVFVTEDVNVSDINTKLTDATIGVVTEEVNLSRDLGLSDDVDWGSGTEIGINVNTHYITQPFSVGMLTVLTTSESLAYQTPALAPDLQLLGRTPPGASLTSIEAGAMLVTGDTAAGRRVFLPWGGNNMDVAYLTADGLTIFRRAIEWGAGAGCGSARPLLLVVGDSDNPSGEDTERQSLIVSWCYAVTLIDASASQADFDAAASINDVVYISEEVDHTQLLTKVRNLPIGVVSEERMQYSHLGFASGMGSSVSMTTVDIVDDGHPISSGLNLGDLAIVSTAQPLQNLQGTLSPDLKAIGVHPSSGYPSLAVLDLGDDIWTGGDPVPARRVFLPWGGDAFQFSELNEDGRTIMRQAIEWAADMDAALAPMAHWKLDETSGTTAIDSVGGHDGTLANGPAWTTGQVDGGLDFDGGDDYVDLTSDSDLDDLFLGGATTAAWIFPTGWGENGYGRILDKSSSASSTGDGWVIRMNADNGGTINFGQGFSGGRGWWKIPNGSISLNAWQHVAVSYDASATTNDPVIYVNGSPVSVSRVDSPSGSVRSDAAINLRLGNHAGGTSHTFAGTIDDVRIYDRILSAGEVADLASTGGGGGGGGGDPGYVEKYNLFTIANSDTWQPVDLSVPGVPANAVAEIAITNSRTGSERWGGVRARGSSLDRRFRLHEAEGGGVDAVIMHVQADSNGHIEAYSDNTSEVTFRLLGYWTGATYVERFDNFSAGGSNSWRSHDFSNEGVGPNQIAEVVIVNTSTSNERLAGIRPSGTSMQRRFNIHEAESGGVDTVSLMVETDASANAEVFAASNSDIDFYVVGYWSTPPGTYAEHGGAHSQISASATWQQWDLTSFGVPANSIVQIVMANDGDTAEQEMGVRATGSSQNRLLDLQEAESGGSDNGTMHVIVDDNARAEAYSESGANDRYFYPVGWWTLN